MNSRIWNPPKPQPLRPFEVYDLSLVPEEYRTAGWLDVGKINCAIRDGVREIPGMRIHVENREGGA